MTSHKAKKKQRAAAARNEAKKIVAAKAKPVEATTVARRKSGAELAQERLEPAGVYVDACLAKRGQKLVNWSRTTMVEFNGEVRHNPGHVRMGQDAIAGEDLEYMFDMWDDQGNALTAMGFKPYYPLRDDAADVARIMERFQYKKAILERKTGKAAERRAADAPPEIDEATGLPIPRAPRKARVPRGDADPRTGCTPGSDGHKFGEVILDTKPGESHRRESVEAIAKLLSSRMDGPKAKALAQSWFSTLLRKRPDIYGKFRGAPAAEKGAAKEADKDVVED